MLLNGKLDGIIRDSSDQCSRVSTTIDDNKLSSANICKDATFSMDISNIKQQLVPPVYVDTCVILVNFIELVLNFGNPTNFCLSLS